MPAYNAEETLEKTYNEIPKSIVDDVILVDDFGTDNTSKLAKQIGIEHVIRHDKNKGYGGNQKTCYNKALELNADIVIMLHPDYQYTPKLIESMAYLIANDVYHVVLGSRILGKGALAGGMPIYKYIANRFLTLAQNILVNHKLSEYHTGYRAFSREVLEGISFNQNDDDFIFDNEMLSQITYAKFRIGEVTCPTKYFEGTSYINFQRSTKYGIGGLRVSIRHFFQRLGLVKLKVMKRLDEKKINSFINAWVRGPGCTAAAAWTYSAWRDGPERMGPPGYAVLLNASLLFYNGNYYSQRVVANEARCRTLEDVKNSSKKDGKKIT